MPLCPPQLVVSFLCQSVRCSFRVRFPSPDRARQSPTDTKKTRSGVINQDFGFFGRRIRHFCTTLPFSVMQPDANHRIEREACQLQAPSQHIVTKNMVREWVRMI